MKNSKDEILEYMIPNIEPFPTEYGLVFGTRHGVPVFVLNLINLYKHGMFTKLIISGGKTQGIATSEAAILSEALIESGFPKENIILEESATNTGENVEFSRRLMINLGMEINELALIGKISSCRRYLMTVRKKWPEIKGVCIHNINYFGVAPVNWRTDDDFKRRILTEYQKIPEYIANGFIEEINVSNRIVG